MGSVPGVPVLAPLLRDKAERQQRAAGDMQQDRLRRTRRDRGECQDRGTTTPNPEGAGHALGR